MQTWTTITAIILPLVTLAGFVLTVVWTVRKNKQAQRETEERAQRFALEEARERGKMEQKHAIMEQQIDAAHVKIRRLDARQDEADRRLTKMESTLEHVKEGVDRLVDIHTSDAR